MCRYTPNPPFIPPPQRDFPPFRSQHGLRDPHPLIRSIPPLIGHIKYNNIHWSASGHIRPLFHPRTARRKRTFSPRRLPPIYLPRTIHYIMSPTCSPASVELMLVPPDQPSPTAPAPTCVRDGEATCDPASTHKQQPHHNDGAIQDRIPTITEADASGEDSDGSDGSDHSAGEYEQGCLH